MVTTAKELFKSPNSKLVILIIVYVIYLFFGASIFDAIESPHEAKIIKDLNEYVRSFRENHSSCLTNDELNAFIKLISTASNKGVSPLFNVTGEQKWTFGQSIFFAGTVLTTIGYGNVSPLTKGGKLFCMLFAIIGIPITLILLTAIIERLMTYTNRLLQYLNEHVQPYVSALFTHRFHFSEFRILFVMICSVIVLVFFLLIPAAIYSSIEGWSYLNSFYYCFISLSTVGLGDYVPGDKALQDYRNLYKTASTAYLIVGILVVVWLLEIYSETPEFNLYKYFTLTKGGQLLSHQPANTNNSNENISNIGIDLRYPSAHDYQSTTNVGASAATSSEMPVATSQLEIVQLASTPSDDQQLQQPISN